MKPRKVKETIQLYNSSNKSLCIDRLKRITGVEYRHRDLQFSSDVFYCDCCNGYRHMVVGLSVLGRLKTLFSSDCEFKQELDSNGPDIKTYNDFEEAHKK